MHAFNPLTQIRPHRRNLLSVFALLTIFLVAAQPLSLLASESHPEHSKKIHTTTKLKVSPTTVKENHKINVTATVTPSKATGTITLYLMTPSGSVENEGTGTLRNGTVSGSGSLQKAGKYEFMAVYHGSKTYASSNSNIVTVKVEK